MYCSRLSHILLPLLGLLDIQTHGIILHLKRERERETFEEGKKIVWIENSTWHWMVSVAGFSFLPRIARWSNIKYKMFGFDPNSMRRCFATGKAQRGELTFLICGYSVSSLLPPPPSFTWVSLVCRFHSSSVIRAFLLRDGFKGEERRTGSGLPGRGF